MAYQKTNWQDNVTPLSAQNMNKIEQGIADAHNAIDTHTTATTGVHGATSAATANAIMQRDANGQANVGTPTAATHIARKQDVDAIQANLNNHTSSTSAGVHGSSTGATPNTLAHRDGSGDLTSRRFISTVAAGTPPMSVTSTTKVTNLNVDRVDDIHFRINNGKLEWSTDGVTWNQAGVRAASGSGTTDASGVLTVGGLDFSPEKVIVQQYVLQYPTENGRLFTDWLAQGISFTGNVQTGSRTWGTVDGDLELSSNGFVCSGLIANRTASWYAYGPIS